MATRKIAKSKDKQLAEEKQKADANVAKLVGKVNALSEKEVALSEKEVVFGSEGGAQKALENMSLEDRIDALKWLRCDRVESQPVTLDDPDILDSPDTGIR